MRIFCILLFLVGLATGVIWPWAQRHFGGEEIGTWVLYQREGGYQSAKVQLKPEDAPLRIFVDAQPMQGVTSGQKPSVLNLAVSRDGVPVLAERLSYSPKSGNEQRDLPQSGAVIRQSAKDMETLQAGTYEFSVRAVEDGLSLTKADLVLRRGAAPVDENITMMGVVVMVAGLYGFMRTRRRQKA
ncbi:hypothetical protein [Pseudochrobactrum saccharolyticum]|uniref:hypothetical protein n=1 Tax=Pseudochrobactrum saccharolyticum TaxID=354352 RepID=UPI002744E55A|nr:hypothetical protein [Pseudochrobactrum saccharolyticum]MDP8251295.1 hypothetical protein [Pseudochrobactrum saccharolyticum]